MSHNLTLAVMGATDQQLQQCQQEIAPIKAIDGSPYLSNLDRLPEDIETLLVYTSKTQQESLALCEQLRTHPQTAALPLIFVAPSYDITHTFVVQRAGNADLLTEPFTLEELQDCLAEFTAETPQSH